ncbi:efflux RND transporter periplasmic adaptor subunit (plasmid) [Verrucomicrobiaceae bacterium 227]
MKLFSLSLLATSLLFTSCKKSAPEEDLPEEAVSNLLELSAPMLGNARLSFAQAERSRISTKVRAYGEIVLSSDRVASVAARIGGLILEDAKPLGDTVRKGDILATIDSQDLANSFLAYRQTATELEFARQDAGRESRLFQKKLTSAESRLLKEQALARAEMAHLTASQAIERLGLGQDQIEVALDTGSGRLLRRWQLKAPISGVITKREFIRGQAVTAEQELYVIADMSQLWVDAKVPLSIANHLKAGDKVTVSSSHQKADCLIKVILPMIDSETRTSQVRALLENKEGQWMPGTPVVLTITRAMSEPVLAVPGEAVLDHEGGHVVFVKKGEASFELREVEIGQRGQDECEILSGLTEGEFVVANNAFLLKAQAQMSGE